VKEDVDEGARLQGLLRGARSAEIVIPIVKRAAEALFDAGKALESIALDLSKIGSNTARAISDTVAMKRSLKTIADREQNMWHELEAIKAQLPKRQKPKMKRRKRKK
jgi:hypothetical protein